MSKDNNLGCDMVGMLDIKGQDQCRRVYSVDGIAPTLTTSGGGQRQVKIFDTKRLRVRKLTPKEYGILQAFPMDRWEQVVSDSQAYKQFGNAVTVTVFTAIAEEIKKTIYEAESEELNMSQEENKAFEGMNAPIEKVEAEENNTAAVETEESKEAQAVAVATETTEEEKAEKPTNILSYDLAAAVIKFLYDAGMLARVCLTTEYTTMLAEHLEENLNGVTIGEAKEENRDWAAAENAVNDILSRYTPNGYMGKVIYPVLLPLKERLESGERTPDLFNAIVEATR